MSKVLRTLFVCLLLFGLGQLIVDALRVWAEIRYYDQQEEEAEVPQWVQL